jgi:hypothetical protein
MAAQRKGRPDKLTSAVHDRIVAAVRAGAHREQAAQAAGVARSTLQAWLARGEASDAPVRFQKFAAEVREAEATFEVGAAAVISRAAIAGDWRAQAWLLERRHPARWGRRTSHEQSGPEGGPIAVADKFDLSKLTAGELETLQEMMERAHGGT